MLMASHLAGVGQASGTGVGLVHALGHSIGTRGKVAHGTALAAVLPEVLRFYLGTRDRELALVGIALGVASAAETEATAAGAAIGAIDKLLRDVDQRRDPASTSASPTTRRSTSSPPTPSTTPRSATPRASRPLPRRGRSWRPSPADRRRESLLDQPPSLNHPDVVPANTVIAGLHR